jgi:site-specific DNA-methyltransferase (adenine-specific)
MLTAAKVLSRVQGNGITLVPAGERLRLRVDPEFQGLIPALSAEERAGLERSILVEGVRDAVVVWGDTILDGHNRYEICMGGNVDGERLHMPEPKQLEFPDRRAAKIWIIENQLEFRRNLSDADKLDLAETKHELIGSLQPKGGGTGANQYQSGKEQPAQSFAPAAESKDSRSTDAKIAKSVGVSRETVRKYRQVKQFGDNRLVSGLKAKNLSMDNAYHLVRVGVECGTETYDALWQAEDRENEKTGRAVNVRYSTAQLAHLLTMPDDETARDLVELVESGQPHPATGKPVASVHVAHGLRQQEREKQERRDRNNQAAANREKRKAEFESSGFHAPDLRNMDFRLANLEEGINAIITDPPYPREYLSMYGDLGEFAARNLEDGGILLAMAGQSYLPEVYRLLGEHLTYVWTLSYKTGGPNINVYPRKVQSGWKPVLLFVKGNKYEGRNYVDYINSEAADKKYHEWGQSESGFVALVDTFTSPGDLVCDPFMGGGTTAVVAYHLKRRFLGMEIETEVHDIAVERIGK